MHKHKFIELQKIIEVRIGTLTEEVEVATNVKLNPLYIVDRKDKIEILRWTTRIIRWILDRAIDGRQQQLGVSKIQTESEDVKKLENMLHDRIQEQETELEDSNTDREKEVIVNGIDTLKCVLDHLFNLKYGEKVCGIAIAEAPLNNESDIDMNSTSRGCLTGYQKDYYCVHGVS